MIPEPVINHNYINTIGQISNVGTDNANTFILRSVS